MTKTVTKMVTNNGLDRAREHHLSWPFKSVFPFFGESEKRFLNSKKGNNCKMGNGLGYAVWETVSKIILTTYCDLCLLATAFISQDHLKY